jgi:hypothetical protein
VRILAALAGFPLALNSLNRYNLGLDSNFLGIFEKSFYEVTISFFFTFLFYQLFSYFVIGANLSSGLSLALNSIHF